MPQPAPQGYGTQAAPSGTTAQGRQSSRGTGTLRYVAAGVGTFVVTLALIALVVLQPWRSANKPLGGGAQDEQGNPAGQPGTEATGIVLRPTLAEGLATKDPIQVTPKLAAWDPGTNLSNVEVVDDFNYVLTDDLKATIVKNGFAVSLETWGYDEFFSLYENNRYSAIPSFVTVDSMMHTYHLYFQYLLKSVERDELSGRLLDLSRQMLQASQDQQEKLRGTEWESAAQRNVAFFAVGASLLDDQASVPSDVQAMVSEELSKIKATSGLSESGITGQKMDYTQFIVRGYYEGDPTLERYFRAMMWYGQAHFKQASEDLDRSALLMMLALKEDTLAQWERIYGVSTFFVGASDDCGYYEYLPAVEDSYGKDATVEDLAGNDSAWKAFHDATANTPAPKISSLPSMGTAEQQKGFRFMGQRFTVDSQIFSQLVYDKVGPNSSGTSRLLPEALDVPAAFGSDEALKILEDSGAASYEGYSDNMAKLREDLSSVTSAFWEASLYSQWIYTLNPLLTPKGEGYPTFMQSGAWARKSLQTYLGSYTELKHDTILYGKQVLAEGDGPMVVDRDDRGYVEPEPEVFARLSRLSQATADGLDRMGVLGDNAREDLKRLASLADRLSAIAVKELEGELPTNEEFELIRSIGVDLEHFWHEVHVEDSENEYFRAMDFPSPLIADIASSTSSTLEIATGKVASMYVVVEVDGKLKLAVGPVYTFFQFEQPSANRMTDTAWREELGTVYQGRTDRTSPPDWTSTFEVVKTGY